MKKSLFLLMVLFLTQSLVAQIKTFDLFEKKSEKKALKWVMKNPNQMIKMEDVMIRSEINQYEFYSDACSISSIHPFELASFKGLTSIIDFYLEQKEITSNIQLLADAYASSVHLNDMEVIQKFIDAGAVNMGTCKLCRNGNALQIALGNDCSKEIVDLFYKGGTDEEFLYEDCKKFNALINAASYENAKYFQYIIKRFPELITKIADDGYSALPFAILSGNVENVNYLLERIDENDLKKIIEGFQKKNDGNFIGLAVQSESSEMIDLIIEKKLGRLYTEDAGKLYADIIQEYYDNLGSWQYMLESFLKEHKKEGLKIEFLKANLKAFLLPESVEFIQKYLENNIDSLNIDIQDDEIYEEIIYYYEALMEHSYVSKIYTVNSVHFEEEVQDLINSLFFFPALFQIDILSEPEILLFIEENKSLISVFEQIKSIVIDDRFGDSEEVTLPSFVFSAERLTIKSNGETSFNFPDFEGDEMKLKKLFVKNAKVKNVPKGVVIVNLQK